MKIAVIDGVAIFSYCTISIDTKLLNDNNFIKTFPLQIEPDGIVCYSEDEYKMAVDTLTSLKITFTVQYPKHSAEHIDKVKDRSYTSRSEAIDHINDKIETPENELSGFLRKKIIDLEDENARLKDKLDIIENDKTQLKSRLDNLERDFLVVKSKGVF